jgi:hypothetical protein
MLRKMLCTVSLALAAFGWQSAAHAVAATAGDAGAAAASCEDKAIDKNGKKLAGAAKASFVKKCEADAKPAGTCEDKAIDKNGKKLAGAAKASFIKKCEADAKAAK